MKIPLANAIFDGDLEIKEFLNINETRKMKDSINNLSFQRVDQKNFQLLN